MNNLMSARLVVLLEALILGAVLCACDDTGGPPDTGDGGDSRRDGETVRPDASERADGSAAIDGGDGPRDGSTSDGGGTVECTLDTDCGMGMRCEAATCVPTGAFEGYEAILNAIVGYGRDVTGGAGGTLVEVTNTNNSGAGSLRAALAVSGPTWIYFTPGLTGTINATSLMYMNSDTTIDGRGANVSIGGHTLNSYVDESIGANNIVLHNLRFSGGLPDTRNLVRLRYGHGFWVDHVTFAAQPGDGKPLTVADAATDITLSWCDFSTSRVGLILLISSDNMSPGDAAIRLTGHHNLFEGTGERHPRARYATIHWFNNFIGDWSGYGSSITQEGYFFAENNVYEAGRSTTDAIITRIGSYPASGDPLEGNLRTLGNWWKNGTVPPVERNPTSVTDPTYPYTAETADEALITAIRAGVGWQDVPSPF